MKPARTEQGKGTHNSIESSIKTKREIEQVAKSLFVRARGFWKKYSESWTAMVGLGILVFFVVLAISAPYIAKNPEQYSVPFYNPLPPGPGHILGTDEYGRDVFSRLAYGAGGTLVECFVALGISLSIGLLAGCMSGYFDGKFSARILDRLAEVLLAVPILLLIIVNPFKAVTYVPLRTAIVTGVWSWGITEKLVRPQALATKAKAHVETARMLGASHLYIIRRHILPACLPAMMTGLVYTAVVAVGIQTAIDYIGINRMVFTIEEVRVAPFLTWGTILSYAILYGSEDPLSKWWLTIVPSFCIVLLMLSLVLIGQRISAVITAERST